MSGLIEELRRCRDLPDDDLLRIIEGRTDDEELFASSFEIRKTYYGRDVFARGLIEISSYCGNDCYYCGLRRSNPRASRYRLDEETILECCRKGYAAGFRTFVMQSGEDSFFTDKRICAIVNDIKEEFPDCAVTLSLGEKPRESYFRYREAGADRYLLRHETADRVHYGRLHPAELSFDERRRCLYDIKDAGLQAGAGFMVGSPYQKTENLVQDIRFLQELEPEMIGIGPFLSHRDTPFHDRRNGSLEVTLRMIAVLRHIFPDILMPATTALATADPRGYEKGLLAGANVVMPNISPQEVRGSYSLYDHKIYSMEEAAGTMAALRKKAASAGLSIVTGRGDRRKRLDIRRT